MPKFCYIKVGYKGYTLNGHVFLMDGKMYAMSYVLLIIQTNVLYIDTYINIDSYKIIWLRTFLLNVDKL